MYTYCLRPSFNFCLRAGDFVSPDDVRVVECHDNFVAEYEITEDRSWRQTEYASPVKARARPIRVAQTGLPDGQLVEVASPTAGIFTPVKDGGWIGLRVGEVVLALVKGPKTIRNAGPVAPGTVLATALSEDVRVAVLKDGKNLFLRPRGLGLSWDGRKRAHDYIYDAWTRRDTGTGAFSVAFFARGGTRVNGLTEKGMEALAEAVGFGPEPLIISSPVSGTFAGRELIGETLRYSVDTEHGRKYFFLPAVVDPIDLPVGAAIGPEVAVADPILRRAWTPEELASLAEDELAWLVRAFTFRPRPAEYVAGARPADIVIRVPAGTQIDGGAVMFAPQQQRHPAAAAAAKEARELLHA